MSRLLALVSRLLPCSDREVILGDLCESELTPVEALFDLTGLIVRRTLEPYADWKTWACLGIAPLISLLLIGLSVALMNEISQFARYSELSLTSMAEILRLGGLLLAASTTSCVAAFRFGRRTQFAVGIAVLSPAVFCFLRYPAAAIPSCCVFLFLLPMLIARLAMARLRSSPTWAVTAALFLLILPGPFAVTDRARLSNVVLLLIPALCCLFSQPKKGPYAY